MSRFDEIREAAIQLRVNKRKRELEDRIRKAAEDITRPTHNFPMGRASPDVQLVIETAIKHANVVYKEEETQAVDAKLLKFLAQDERDKEDSLKKEFPLVKYEGIGGVAQTGRINQVYNKES